MWYSGCCSSLFSSIFGVPKKEKLLSEELFLACFVWKCFRKDPNICYRPCRQMLDVEIDKWFLWTHSSPTTTETKIFKNEWLCKMFHLPFSFRSSMKSAYIEPELKRVCHNNNKNETRARNNVLVLWHFFNNLHLITFVLSLPVCLQPHFFFSFCSRNSILVNEDLVTLWLATTSFNLTSQQSV